MIDVEPIEAPAEANWVGVIRQLCDHLQENEHKLQFLRKIDQGMINLDLSLDQFISNNMEKLPLFTHANWAHLYIDSGDDLYLAHTTSLRGVAEPRLLRDQLDIKLPPDHKKFIVIERNDLGALKQLFPHASSLLLAPIWLQPDLFPRPLTGHRLGVIILESQHPEQMTSFRDQAIQSFVHTVVGQLALGIQFRATNRRSKWLNELTESFFTLDLEPNACFRQLAMKVPDFLPDFGPLRLKSKPGVSIAIYHSKGDYLTLVGSSDGQYSGTKLKVNSSVTGLLFENPDMSYILGDPYHDPMLKSRYKAYLSKEIGKQIKTELAAPIKDGNGNRIAVVNLESELENAFAKVHIDSVLELCNILAPMITALHSRIMERDMRQEAMLYAQQSYWNTVGAVLRHNTNGQLAAIRLGLDNTQTAIKRGLTDRTEQILPPIYNSLESVTQEIDEFSRELYGYTVYGSYSVRHLTTEAIGRVRRSLDKREGLEKKVQIDFPPDEDFRVFCSPLLKMHLYNLIDNSLYWIGHRMTKEVGHQGRILVTVKPGPLPDEDQEQELNRTCEVRVRDNGPGCPLEIVSKLLHQPVTSRRTGGQGMGHALYAAANYVFALGGSMEVESKEGEWFEVIIQLPIFDDRIHKPKNFAEG